ncbi:MAG: DUF433 domain-containing protein [Kofleriaceae bacterium]|nr:MAG: DUF433 domain-containing protein [Kofleriaceae bacterium]MBZ0231449.1 DUF433 domain-containing protein [Kofleriaceae bacterium]
MGKVVSLYSGRDPRDVPMYGIGDASVYLGVPRSTLATWIRGQRVRGRTLMKPLIKADRATGLLSFNNLAEAYVLASLTRRFDVPLRRVRNALEYVGGERPLLTTPFRTDGVGVFVEELGKLIDAARGGQAAIRETVESNLRRVDLDERELPLRLYPWRLDPSEPRIIALDPRRSFGRPTVVGSAVQSETIIDRYRGGESIGYLSSEYGLDRDVIEGVLRWGLDAEKAA